MPDESASSLRTAARMARVAHSADNPTRLHAILAGLILTLFIMASWAMTWVIGARQVLQDLMHREAAGISGLEMVAFGLWALGLAVMVGLGWTIGTKLRK